jgi:hypothetical protein
MLKGKNFLANISSSVKKNAIFLSPLLLQKEIPLSVPGDLLRFQFRKQKAIIARLSRGKWLTIGRDSM